ncbi:MAG: hypothetical protein ACPIOQ_78115, partial [Promethearchaeia archaeon]
SPPVPGGNGPWGALLILYEWFEIPAQGRVSRGLIISSSLRRGNGRWRLLCWRATRKTFV